MQGLFLAPIQYLLHLPYLYVGSCFKGFIIGVPMPIEPVPDIWLFEICMFSVMSQL